MAKKYIELDRALKEIERFIGYLDEDMIYRIQYALKRLPAADSTPMKHGYWIGLDYDGYADGSPVYTSFECSECGAEYEHDETYCPNCGALMDGDE